MSWDLPFAEPILLTDGRKLATLREAIAHLGKIIPKSEHGMKEVQAAAHWSHSRGSVSCRRSTAHVERVFDPARKDHRLQR